MMPLSCEGRPFLPPRYSHRHCDHSRIDIHCINLSSRPDRWEQVSGLFEAFPFVNLVRFEAVASEPPFIGCGLSHQALIRRAQTEGWPYVVVVEDDCQPTPAFARFTHLLRELENMPDWNVFLGGPWRADCFGTHGAFCRIRKFLDTHLVLYRQSAYEVMLRWPSAPDGTTKEIDFWMQSQEELKVITHVPFIAVQRPDYSDVGRSWADKTETYRETEATLLAKLRGEG